jgi:hypothetical protein
LLLLVGFLPWLAPAANAGLSSGLYQIVSGDYSSCCGIAGSVRSSLPTSDQSFLRLTIDPQSNVARIAVLDVTMKTVFSVAVCPPGDAINFDFGYGFALSNSIVFHVDPGPPPQNLYWNYTVSNSTAGLRVDGSVGVSPGLCADVPNLFTHSNVIAVLVPQPKLEVTDFAKEGPLVVVQGEAGRTNVLETSTDLLDWLPVSTNVMRFIEVQPVRAEPAGTCH